MSKRVKVTYGVMGMLEHRERARPLLEAAKNNYFMLARDIMMVLQCT